MKTLRITCFAVVLFQASSTPADLLSDLNDFYDDTTTYANATPFGAYQGQTTNMITGGGLSWRTPVKNVNPISIQLPRVRSGCGGIDLFTGGISFISGQELVNLIQSIGSPAVLSYGLMIAIKVLSPEAADLLETLQSWAQKANALNINSCEASRALVSGAFKAVAGKEWGCISNRLMAGDDYSKAKQFCGAGGGTATTPPPPEQEKHLPLLKGNLVWKALSEAGYVSDVGLSEGLMSLSGSVIVRPNATGTDDETYPLPPMLGDGSGETLIRALLYGGQASVWKCDTTTADGCLYPTLSTIHVPVERSLTRRAFMDLLMLAISIHMDQEPTTWGSNLEKFIQSSPYPIYQYMTTMVATGGLTLMINRAGYYAEVIAYQLLHLYLTDALSTVVRAVDASRANKDDQAYKQLRDNIARAMRVVERMRDDIKSQADLQAELTKEMLLYKKMLAARVPAASFKAVGEHKGTTARVQ